jgi:hypothetical protein
MNAKTQQIIEKYSLPFYRLQEIGDMINDLDENIKFNGDVELFTNDLIRNLQITNPNEKKFIIDLVNYGFQFQSRLN